MIEHDDCVCVCGFDCEGVISQRSLAPGDKFNCPQCQRLLGVGMGDYAVEDEQGGYDVIECLYTTEERS